jgi:hypothetical protein
MIAHIKVKVYGGPEKVRLFHTAARIFDREWPFASNKHMSDAYMQRMRLNCTKCGGKSYSTPRLAPQDIKLLGKQLKIKVKIKHFGLQERCKDGQGALSYSAPQVPKQEVIANSSNDSSTSACASSHGQANSVVLWGVQ